VAMAALNTAMGVSTGQTIAPVDPLARRDLPKKTLEEWVLLSLEKRPDLLMLDFQEQVASAEVKKARAAHLPSVNVNGSYEINSEDLGDSADNYTVGADVSLNLFSGYRVSSRRQEALFRQQAAKDYQRAMRQQAELEVRQAYYDILSAGKRIRAAEISVDQADEALRIVGDRYKTGLLPIVSLLDAEAALYRAKNNRNRALYQHVMARTRLAQAAGILDKDFVLCAENHH
jgi:outer membrane protein